MAPAHPISPHPWLDELGHRLESVLEMGDARSVHQLRVAAGRLSVWMELGGRRALRDDLRRMRRLVTQVRDADVLIERRSVAGNYDRLRELRASELARARAVLATSAPRALVVGLACVPWPEFDAAEKRAAAFAFRVVFSARVVEKGDHSDEAVHRWRRRVRRARYALEWLGRDSTRARELQDILGAWHDASIEAASDVPEGDSSPDARLDAARREREALLEAALSNFDSDREQWLAWASSKGRAWTST